MSAPDPAQAEQWWRTLDEHRQVDGRCSYPQCRKFRRCRPWADAFAELVAHDLFHLGPPPPSTGRTPQPVHHKELSKV